MDFGTFVFEPAAIVDLLVRAAFLGAGVGALLAGLTAVYRR
jgi:hypothetical protein